MKIRVLLLFLVYLTIKSSVAGADQVDWVQCGKTMITSGYDEAKKGAVEISQAAVYITRVAIGGNLHSANDYLDSKYQKPLPETMDFFRTEVAVHSEFMAGFDKFVQSLDQPQVYNAMADSIATGTRDVSGHVTNFVSVMVTRQGSQGEIARACDDLGLVVVGVVAGTAKIIRYLRGTTVALGVEDETTFYARRPSPRNWAEGAYKVVGQRLILAPEVSEENFDVKAFGRHFEHSFAEGVAKFPTQGVTDRQRLAALIEKGKSQGLMRGEWEEARDIYELYAN